MFRFEFKPRIYENIFNMKLNYFGFREKKKCSIWAKKSHLCGVGHSAQVAVWMCF